MVDANKINLLCNTLNAQEGLSRQKYINAINQREFDLMNIFHQAQIMIRELQEEIERLKEK